MLGNRALQGAHLLGPAHRGGDGLIVLPAAPKGLLHAFTRQMVRGQCNCTMLLRGPRPAPSLPCLPLLGLPDSSNNDSSWKIQRCGLVD